MTRTGVVDAGTGVAVGQVVGFLLPVAATALALWWSLVGTTGALLAVAGGLGMGVGLCYLAARSATDSVSTPALVVGVVVIGGSMVTVGVYGLYAVDAPAVPALAWTWVLVPVALHVREQR